MSSSSDVCALDPTANVLSSAARCDACLSCSAYCPLCENDEQLHHLHFDSLSTSPTLLPSRGLVTLPRSPRSGVLFTLSSTSASSYPAILARSYDGRPWELTRPGALRPGGMQVMGCSPRGCTLRLPNNDNYTAEERMLDRASTTTTAEQRAAARLLLQATFGPTRSLLHNLTNRLTTSTANTTDAVLSGWIREQMDIPPTLHRAHWRKRVSPRTQVPYHATAENVL